jgi:hypothetical protein
MLVLRDLLKNKPERPQIVQKPVSIDDTLFCDYCGSACQPFLRQDFLRSRHPRRQPMIGMARN